MHDMANGAKHWPTLAELTTVLTRHSRRSALRLHCHPAKAGQRQRLAQQRLAWERWPASGRRQLLMGALLLVGRRGRQQLLMGA